MFLAGIGEWRGIFYRIHGVVGLLVMLFVVAPVVGGVLGGILKMVWMLYVTINCHMPQICVISAGLHLLESVKERIRLQNNLSPLWMEQVNVEDTQFYCADAMTVTGVEVEGLSDLS